MQDRIALAIVAAGALVGAGLYFGLRARAPAAPLPTPAASTLSTGEPAPYAGAAAQHLAAPAVPPGAAAPSATPEKVRADAMAALEGLKRQVLDTCWRPALSREPQPSRSSYMVDVTFAADGTTLAMGLSEFRERPSRPDVAQCVRTSGALLRIPPPGAGFRIELPLEFP
jgi:hypothetical protein